MWIYLSLISALLLGIYDITKKKALDHNNVMWVLFATSAISTLLLSPFFRTSGNVNDILVLGPKAVLVTLSWISGLIGMKLLPMTIAGTIKASRPVFVILMCVIIFGETLTVMQWAGVVVAISALFMLSRSSKKEGIVFTHSKGVLWMSVSVVAGVTSALYDKFVISSLHLEPMFVQCWSNLWITIMMGIVLSSQILWRRNDDSVRFRWDWGLVLTSVLIVSADAAYFYALAQEGSMLSIISLLRRFSVVVTFVLGAIIFKETNLKDKAIDLAVLLAGITILVFNEQIQQIVSQLIIR